MSRNASNQPSHPEHRTTSTGRQSRSAEGNAPQVDALLQAAWEASPDAMAVSDANGTVLAANAAYYRLYGYTPEEVLGHNFALIFPVEAREYAQELYIYMFRSPAISSPVESVARRADGYELFLESRYSFITREGERVAMISSIRDITERKQREEMLRDSQQVMQFMLEVTHLESWEWD